MTKMIFLSLGLVFFSAPVLACPLLSGTWECTNEDGKVKMVTVSQESLPSQTIYHFQDSLGYKRDFPADGKTHNWDEAERSGWLRVSCRGDRAILGSDQVKNSRRVKVTNSEFSYTLSNSSTMVMAMTTTLRLGSQPPRVQQHRQDCVHK